LRPKEANSIEERSKPKKERVQTENKGAKSNSHYLIGLYIGLGLELFVGGTNTLTTWFYVSAYHCILLFFSFSKI